MQSNATASRIYLLRHAESSDPRVFHGAESDVGLSERGRRQAEGVARYFAACGIDAVVSSAMIRARDTAAPIARLCSVPHEIDPDLHERRVGPLSGTPTNLLDGVWPDTLARWMRGETGYAPAGAESFDAIRDRVLPAWERIVSAHAGQRVVVVAHGIVCRVLLLSLLDEFTVADWQRVPTPNVGVSELAMGAGRWKLERLAEVPAEAGEDKER